MDAHPAFEPHEQEYLLPSADALLAGTLALMTGHAQSHDPQLRDLLAFKIHAHLLRLQNEPRLSPPFRQIVQRLHSAWARMGEPAASAPGFADPLWQAANTRLQ